MLIQWEDELKNLYEIKIHGSVNCPYGIVKMWASDQRKSAVSGVHTILYEKNGNLSLSDLASNIAKVAEMHGCPDTKVNKIYDTGLMWNKDGSID